MPDPLDALIARLSEARGAYAMCCCVCGRFVVAWKSGHAVVEDGLEYCGGTIERITNEAATAALRARASSPKEGAPS